MKKRIFFTIFIAAAWLFAGCSNSSEGGGVESPEVQTMPGTGSITLSLPSFLPEKGRTMISSGGSAPIPGTAQDVTVSVNSFEVFVGAFVGSSLRTYSKQTVAAGSKVTITDIPPGLCAVYVRGMGTKTTSGAGAGPDVTVAQNWFGSTFVSIEAEKTSSARITLEDCNATSIPLSFENGGPGPLSITEANEGSREYIQTIYLNIKNPFTGESYSRFYLINSSILKSEGGNPPARWASDNKILDVPLGMFIRPPFFSEYWEIHAMCFNADGTFYGEDEVKVYSDDITEVSDEKKYSDIFYDLNSGGQVPQTGLNMHSSEFDDLECIPPELPFEGGKRPDYASAGMHFWLPEMNAVEAKNVSFTYPDQVTKNGFNYSTIMWQTNPRYAPENPDSDEVLLVEDFFGVPVIARTADAEFDQAIGIFYLPLVQKVALYREGTSTLVEEDQIPVLVGRKYAIGSGVQKKIFGIEYGTTQPIIPYGEIQATQTGPAINTQFISENSNTVMVDANGYVVPLTTTGGELARVNGIACVPSCNKTVGTVSFTLYTGVMGSVGVNAVAGWTATYSSPTAADGKYHVGNSVTVTVTPGAMTLLDSDWDYMTDHWTWAESAQGRLYGAEGQSPDFNKAFGTITGNLKVGSPYGTNDEYPGMVFPAIKISEDDYFVLQPGIYAESE